MNLTALKEIKSFFGPLGDEITEHKEDVENTWFITFSTEDNAIDAVLKYKGKKLGDQKVSIRMKSDNIVKTKYVHCTFSVL